MTGSQSDFIRRIKSALPLAWFPDASPTLDSILTGIGNAWSWVYSLVILVSQQTRIATASGIWLELIARDFFGNWLQRASRESDDHYRDRILATLLREKTTRGSLQRALEDLTGRSPRIFEPGRCADTGGYGVSPGHTGGLGYNTTGGWGNLDLPNQCFVTAYRPIGAGIGLVSGWGCPSGGYGIGGIEYANIGLMEDTVSDSDILSMISNTLPAATIAWTRIAS